MERPDSIDTVEDVFREKPEVFSTTRAASVYCGSTATPISSQEYVQQQVAQCHTCCDRAILLIPEWDHQLDIDQNELAQILSHWEIPVSAANDLFLSEVYGYCRSSTDTIDYVWYRLHFARDVRTTGVLRVLLCIGRRVEQDVFYVLVICPRDSILRAQNLIQLFKDRNRTLNLSWILEATVFQATLVDFVLATWKAQLDPMTTVVTRIVCLLF
jgi:hypothetical protein